MAQRDQLGYPRAAGSQAEKGHLFGLGRVVTRIGGVAPQRFNRHDGFGGHGQPALQLHHCPLCSTIGDNQGLFQLQPNLLQPFQLAIGFPIGRWHGGHHRNKTAQKASPKAG